MPVRARRLICAALLAIALVPSGAMAKGGKFTIAASRSEELHLRGTNGYSFTVSANHGTVSLRTERGGESATYSTLGNTSRGHIRARFGKLGLVAVRLHPSGKPRAVPEPDGNCRSKGTLVTTGTFVGTIAFRGEQLYTSAQTRRVKGKEVLSFKQICHREKEGQGHPIRWAIISAQADPQTTKSEAKFESFNAVKITSAAHSRLDSAFFTATLVEDRQRLSIIRTTSVTADPSTFSLVKTDAGRTTVTITPPKPFLGTAAYAQEKGVPSSWSGELSVPFLGVGVLSLTEPGWTAKLEVF